MTHTRKHTATVPLLLALILFATALSAFAGVTVTSPVNGSTVTSPVHVVASATSSYPIASMRIYLDYVSAYTVYASSMNYYLTASTGTHSLIVQAWDSTGAVFKNTMTITVSGTATTTPTPTVTSMSPTSGTTAGGTTVTINGSGFTSTSKVTFGGTAATGFSYVSSSQVKAVTPSHAAGVVAVAVANGTSSGSLANAYTYVSPTTTAPSTTLSITTSALPGGTAGTTYSATLAATGGTSPYKWSLYSGTLPAGVTLATTGAISGTPTSAGTYSFTVKATDSATTAQSTTKALSIVVASAPAPTPVSGTMCGKPDDHLVHYPPDYTTFVPPAMGGSYLDQMYGCTIKRLSKPQMFNTSVHHYYSSVVAMNLDDTLVLMRRESGGYYVASASDGSVYYDVHLSAGVEPVWSRKDAHVFYYHTGNSLMKYDLLARTASVVHQFTQYSSITFGGSSGGGTEGDLSEDGDHIIIAGNGYIIGVYTFSTNTLGRTLNAGSATAFDYFDMTPSNHVVARWTNVSKISYYDQNMTFIRDVLPFGAHADRGRDPVDGSDIIVISSAPDKATVCGPYSGVEKVRLSDSKKTCLLHIPFWGDVTHISVSSKGGIAIAEVGDTSGTWHVYSNEIVALKLDGSGAQRLAQDRSRASYYWAQPRASVSMDGKYVIFDSNYGQSTGYSNYTDVYSVRVMQ